MLLLGVTNDSSIRFVYLHVFKNQHSYFKSAVMMKYFCIKIQLLVERRLYKTLAERSRLRLVVSLKEFCINMTINIIHILSNVV